MVNIYVYDITFFVLFTLFIIIFLYRNKKNISREGLMILYRTQLAIKSMDWFNKKFHRALGYLRYVIVANGFVLMILMVLLLLQSVWVYISQPAIVDVIKAPPIAPIFPYFTEVFGLQSIFPPFYFTYFLVALAIVAFVHEFGHGIYMRYSKIKIKSTGVAFLGPILGAFVEEDRKSFDSKNRLNQMAVLGAGVFANVIFALLFYFLYIGFFYLSFSAAGYIFNSYSLVPIEVDSINEVYEDNGFLTIIVDSERYYFNSSRIEPKNIYDYKMINAYHDSPAFRAKLRGIIIGVDEHKIKTQEDLTNVLSMYSPGDSIRVYTLLDSKRNSFDITLDSHPSDSERAYLGVGYYGVQPRNLIQKFLASLMSFRIGSTYYEANYNSDLAYFIFYLLWWIMLINFLVALFNMLPLGILDGGKFFELSVEKIAGTKIAKKAFSFMTRLIFFIFLFLMLIWIFRII